MTLQPEQARQIGRIGGYSKAAKYPVGELTKAARLGFMARFEPADPDLDEAERRRRTQAALNAHMARLAHKSARARRQKRHARTTKNATTTVQAGIETTDRNRMSDATYTNPSDKLIPEAIPNA